MKFQKDPVLIVGNEMMAFSITVCLLHAKHPVTLLTNRKSEAIAAINAHLSDMEGDAVNVAERNTFKMINHLNRHESFNLAIAIDAEDLETKRSVISQLEGCLPAEALIAINTESISLAEIQGGANLPERILGLNWVEPAHTTFFLEIIANEMTSQHLVHELVTVARASWQKDPYVLTKGMGIRSRMMSAMVREAFYLLENGYISPEDVDRACRNDPGYYLPFAGHCRYMDLMGTYVYGLVMKDLNPELSKDSRIPAFFTRLVEEGAEGIKTKKGFYLYKDGEVERRVKEFRRFTYEIRDIIAKYPFNYLTQRKQHQRQPVSNL